MAPKKSSKSEKTAAPVAPGFEPVEQVASRSKMPKGTGSKRLSNRFITVYGPFKSRKTTSLSKLPMGRTKWIASDANCVPTLDALGRMPHPDDVHELNNLPALREFLETTLKLAEDAVTVGADPKDELGIDYLVVDSYTQYNDWHQQDVAKDTGQRYMGDNEKNNGWQRFNAEFGTCLDLLAALARYITVIGIVHSKPKFDAKKGEYASFTLPPAMADKLGRLSNWILLKSFQEVIDDVKRERAIEDVGNPFFSVEEGRAPGEKTVYEDIFYTRPTAGWVASVNSLKLKDEEPGSDIMLLLEKDGLLP